MKLIDQLTSAVRNMQLEGRETKGRAFCLAYAVGLKIKEMADAQARGEISRSLDPNSQDTLVMEHMGYVDGRPIRKMFALTAKGRDAYQTLRNENFY